MKYKDLLKNNQFLEMEVDNELLEKLGVNVKIKNGEKYFCIDSNYRIYTVYFYDNVYNKIHIETNNFYPCKKFTREQVEEIAQKKLKYDKAYCKIVNRIKELNNGWKPNWKDFNEEKYYIYFDYSINLFIFGYNYGLSHNYDNNIFLKTRGLAEQVLKELKEEYKIIFEVE